VLLKSTDPAGDSMHDDDADNETAPTDERPTDQEFQSLIWKNGERTEEIRIMDEVKP